MMVMLSSKVKKFCISLLESAGSFAYTRGVMGELDASIRFPVQFISYTSLLALKRQKQTLEKYISGISFVLGPKWRDLEETGLLLKCWTSSKIGKKTEWHLLSSCDDSL